MSHWFGDPGAPTSPSFSNCSSFDTDSPLSWSSRSPDLSAFRSDGANISFPSECTSSSFPPNCECCRTQITSPNPLLVGCYLPVSPIHAAFGNYSGLSTIQGCDSPQYLREHMASPYVYPQYLYSTPYLWPYYQQVAPSPFVPPNQLPPSPRAGEGTRRVRFADEETEYPPTRPRPPSWHAGMAGTAPAPNPLPFPSPPLIYTSLPVGAPPVAMPPVGPPSGYAPHRRRSDSSAPGIHPGWISVPTWMVYHSVPAPPAPQFHPLLNGELGNRPLLSFDLSVHAFNPLRITSPGQTAGQALTLDELSQQATYPAVTRMKITCDHIPQWDIILEPQHDRPSHSGHLTVPSTTSPAPITVGDILVAIHRVLQHPISHRDWARLTDSQETGISRAYTRRCRTFPSAAEFESRQGVRRVDYLLDRYMFKGLTRVRGEDGFEEVRLLVGPR